MRYRFILSVLAVLPSMAAGQVAPEPLWITQFGANSSDGARAAVSDATGVFVAGDTRGSLAAPNQGGWDVFLVRYDRDGHQMWARQLGTSGDDYVRGAAIDDAGGVYIGGYHHPDAWLARYTGAGERLWLRHPLLSLPGSHINAMAPDGAGGVYIGGRTFDANVVVARVDKDGEAMWIRTFGSSGVESAAAVASDGAGGMFVGGSTSGSLGAPSSGLQDAWLARYDAAGNRLWIHQWGDPVGGAVSVSTAAPDGAGGAYVAGLTGGPSSHTRYVARYESGGDRLWATLLTRFNIGITGVAPDAAGGVYVTGMTKGDVNAPNWWSDDILLARYDGAGNLVWIKEFGTHQLDWGRTVTPDHAGGVYLAGETNGNLAGASPPPPSSWGAFVARFPSGDPEPCYANCDGSTAEPVLNVDDFTCFINEFAAAQSLPQAQQIEHYANCDGSTSAPVLTVDDFTCFIDAFAQGCP